MPSSGGSSPGAVATSFTPTFRAANSVTIIVPTVMHVTAVDRYRSYHAFCIPPSKVGIFKLCALYFLYDLFAGSRKLWVNATAVRK